MATGTIRVQNESLRQQLVADSVGLSQTSSLTLRSASSRSAMTADHFGRGSLPVMNRSPTHSHAAPQRSRRNAEDREKARAELRERYTEEQERIKRGLQMRREQQQRDEEERFASLYNELMMEEEDFVALVKEYCKLDDENRLRKQATLCREWHEKVFNKVQRQIGKQLKQLSSHEIAERRRKLYNQFLAAANSKESGLFRDIIIENEYDPMIAHKHTIKYNAHLEDDPVKLELNKAARESQVLPGEFQEKVELGRDTLKTTLWDKLDSTPYGRFNKMMEATKADHGTFRTNLQMDHYSYERVRDLRAPAAPRHPAGICRARAHPRSVRASARRAMWRSPCPCTPPRLG
jgi:hypothetical protein